MSQPLEDNEILKSISRGDHFIPGMGIFMSINDDGTHHLDAEITDRVADVSFIGMLADMTAGQTIITARAPCESATLHIEVHAVNNLVGPGTIVGRTRVLTVSKRRGAMETIFEDEFSLGDVDIEAVLVVGVMVVGVVLLFVFVE